MNRDTVIENWLASMSKFELIDQCFLWHDMALIHGHMYNIVKNENAKLRDENSMLRKYAPMTLSAISYCDCCLYADCGCDTETVPMHEGCKAFEELRDLGVEVDE